MPVLPDNTTQMIQRLCGGGYHAYDGEDYKKALRLFYQAWLLLPKPQYCLKEAGWILTAIGDTYFRLEQWEQALEALQSACYCPGAGKTAFVRLRLGQTYLELNHYPLARKHLLRAWRDGGDRLFEREPPHYRMAIDDLLKMRAVG